MMIPRFLTGLACLAAAQVALADGSRVDVSVYGDSCAARTGRADPFPAAFVPDPR